MEKPNLNYIKQLSGSDLLFKNELINLIKEEFSSEKKEYYDNLKNNDLIKTAGNVHKLKHKITIFGLVKSHELAQQYENELREGSSITSAKFSIILDVISNFIEEI